MKLLRPSVPSMLTFACLALFLPARLAQAQLLKPPAAAQADGRGGAKAAAAPQAKPRGSETLGAITFVPPSGWKRKAVADMVSFETTDSKQGRWAILGVYRDQPGSGNAGQDFASQWQQIVGAQFNAPLPNEIDTSQHPAGYEIKVGGTQVQSEMGGAVAILVVASGHGVAISTLFLTNHNDYVPQLDRFMQGVTLDKPKPGSVAQRPPATLTPAAAAAAQPTAPAHNSTPSSGGAHPGELVGTWVAGSVSGPALYDRVSGMFSTYASGSGGQLELKPNGQASWVRIMRNNYGCTSGFNTFYDGTWSASGNKLAFNWTQGKKETVTCGKTKPATTPFKPMTEEWYVNLYMFEGQPKLGLATKPGGENTWSYSFAGR